MPPPKVQAKTPTQNPVVLTLLDTIVSLLRGVAPASLLLVAFRIWAYTTGRRSSLVLSRTSIWRRLLNLWLIVEACFFAYTRYVSLRAESQPEQHKVARLESDDRRRLFERCLETVSSPQAFAASWYRSEHGFDDLKRGNVQEWLAWGLFHKHDYEHEMTADQRDELDGFVARFERACRECDPSWQGLPEGYNRDCVLMKFSNEPVVHQHRPLVAYSLVHVLLQECITPLKMHWMGFSRNKFRSVTYQYRQGALGNSTQPLVFIHGLGVGPIPYAKFLARLIEKTQDESSDLYGRSLFCLELHAVSQRLMPQDLLPHEFVDDVTALFRQHHRFPEHIGAIIMGHSYGSFPTSWLCKMNPGLCAGVVLLDPACLLLHHTKIVFNILYRQPAQAVERFMDYFIKTELFFNAHARRHFFWYVNILFLEDIDTLTKPTMVLLSEDDEMLPIAECVDYIKAYNQGTRLASQSHTHPPGGPVELLYLEQCEHGGFLWNSDFRDRVVASIEKIANRCV